MVAVTVQVPIVAPAVSVVPLIVQSPVVAYVTAPVPEPPLVLKVEVPVIATIEEALALAVKVAWLPVVTVKVAVVLACA